MGERSYVRSPIGDARLLGETSPRRPKRRSWTAGSTPGTSATSTTDDHLYIVDRKKDLIIRGGFNVFPQRRRGGAPRAPGDRSGRGRGQVRTRAHGEEVVAFVELRLGARGRHGRPGRVREAADFGGYKYPREVHVVPSLPLTPVGKVDRKKLRETTTGGSDSMTTKLTLAELEASEERALGTATGWRSSRSGSISSPRRPVTTSGSTWTPNGRRPAPSVRRSRTAISRCRCSRSSSRRSCASRA